MSKKYNEVKRMQTLENRAAQKKQSLDVISVRRNPYLVDYEMQKSPRKSVNKSYGRSEEAASERDRRVSGGVYERGRRASAAVNERSRRTSAAVNERDRRVSGGVYERGRRASGAINERGRRASAAVNERNRRVSGGVYERGQRTSGAINERGRKASAAVNERNRRVSGGVYERNRRPSGAGNRNTQRSLEIVDIRGGRSMSGTAAQWQHRTVPADRRRNSAAARRLRRRQVRRRKMTVAAWMLCILMTGWLILLKTGNASEVKQDDNEQELLTAQEESLNTSSIIVQGISAEDFGKHPAWTEDFLPLNEYSRPGETLPEVKDIFVHYTANKGTSAAQNRSYFAQQKDMHQASVSAHFIIGYDGEIIQCVPLDEIAYAVQTRNYDSISIECCYTAANGSFTQATYDSLTSLLAWLTDAYDLDTGHILRHYDCGGKKCPLYYTEHEDAWGRLKEDVAAKKEK